MISLFMMSEVKTTDGNLSPFSISCLWQVTSKRIEYILEVKLITSKFELKNRILLKWSVLDSLEHPANLTEF